MIFINDLDEDISSNILKFADDTKIFKEIRCSSDCSHLKADLDKLVLWAQKWQMVFNVDKCVGFVAAAVSMPMGGCRARVFVSSLPVVVVDVVVAVRLAVL